MGTYSRIGPRQSYMETYSRIGLGQNYIGTYSLIGLGHMGTYSRIGLGQSYTGTYSCIGPGQSYTSTYSRIGLGRSYMGTGVVWQVVCYSHIGLLLSPWFPFVHLPYHQSPATMLLKFEISAEATDWTGAMKSWINSPLVSSLVLHLPSRFECNFTRVLSSNSIGQVMSHFFSFSNVLHLAYELCA